MKLVEIKQGPVMIPAGVCVQPSQDQLRRRAHAMAHVRDGVYMTTGPTGWKTGELILTDWVIDKSMTNHAAYADTGEPGEAEQEPAAVAVDIAALKELKVKDLIPKIAELSTDELDELAEIDTRSTIQEEIEKARANMPTVSKFGATE